MIKEKQSVRPESITVQWKLLLTKKFTAVANLPRHGLPRRFTPRSGHAVLRETAKNPRAPSQILQASISMLNVKVHPSTSRKKLNKLPRESLFSLKKNLAAQLSLQGCIWTNHRISGTMSLGQKKPQRKYLVIMQSTEFSENQTQHVNTNTSFQTSSTWWRADYLGFQPRILGTLQSWSSSWACLYTKVF